MQRCPPPYRPLRGAEPPHFVDRADEATPGATGIVATTMAAYQAGPDDPRFHQLVISAPAMGKTALLRAIARGAAGELDWAVARHRCRPKERAIGAVATEVLTRVRDQWPSEGAQLARQVLSPGSAALRPRRCEGYRAGGTVAPVPPYLAPGAEASWGKLNLTLQLAGRFAEGIGRGLLVVLDDADYLGGGEVESLGHLARSLSREGLPVALLLSAGPQLADRFARVGNFSRTVWPTSLGWFDDVEAREALVVPATDRDVEFEDKALELLCSMAAGAPLELQRLGFAAWSSAREGDLITLADVEEAMGLVTPVPAGRAP